MDRGDGEAIGSPEACFEPTPPRQAYGKTVAEDAFSRTVAFFKGRVPNTSAAGG
ncbi:MAG: hypothetical protein IPP90_14800 [Gemmatimonadaceae bacterium]|nr:hypothetical protein [Gemmatimonadaceae bacterium]